MGNTLRLTTRATSQGDEDTTAVKAHPRVADKKAVPRRCPACQQVFSGAARFCPFDGEVLMEAPDWNPTSDPLIGQIVANRYEVVSVIGEGSTGTVYEVRHATLGRRFALKVLRADIADSEHVARFLQEAKATAAIGHPNIVAVTDFGELPPGPRSRSPLPYFVMELLSGMSLATVLRAGKTISVERAAAIISQAAAGLGAAHSAGVIHRDVKPDNVHLLREGEREVVKLLDFGLAKMAGGGKLTRAGIVFGTAHYMSPEQASGETVDHRADIYALGVVLYECLAGRVPFEADNYVGVLRHHMTTPPELPPSLGPLAPVVARCLAKNPAERYPSMTELAAALEPFVEAHPSSVPSIFPGTDRSSSPRASQAGDRSSDLPTPVKPIAGTLIPIAVVGISLVTVLAYLLVMRDPEKSPAPAARPIASETKPAAAPPKDDPPPIPAETTTPSAKPAPSSASAPSSAPAKTPPHSPTPPITEPPPPAKHPTHTKPTHEGVVDPW